MLGTSPLFPIICNSSHVLLTGFLFSIEYGAECYCDNRVNYAGGARANKQCTDVTLMACPGNKGELCGGPSLMTLFYSTLTPGTGTHKKRRRGKVLEVAAS